ncbi:hypothetical protein MANES_16G064101v8 [Manihot esculenta]|uniref:Uncharacterized protein n=1 Tax=Manihot esculenta TaxID=3983 RepID=A0ACB7G6X9_MANES|nr:hypothetical protein MANES_16G064101v8 [Manihot esculenta]
MITTLRWRIPLNRSCSIWAFIPLELSPSLTPIYFAMAISLIFKPSSVLLIYKDHPSCWVHQRYKVLNGTSLHNLGFVFMKY